MNRKALLILLLFVLQTDQKKIGFNLGRGNSASRGSSGSRQQAVNSYQQHQQYPNQHVNQPQVYPQQPSYNQGGYHQQPNPGVIHQQQPNIGYNHGGYQQPNYHINNPNTGIHTGTGLGSPRSGQWKTALAAGAAGAIGGVLAWEAGKAIIRSATEPAHINGRDYYFTNDDNKYQKKAGEIMCSMDFQESIKQSQQAQTTTTAAPDGNTNDTTTSTTPSPDQLLSSMQFKDGSRPKKIVWTCRAGTEVCCGSDCCPAPSVQQQPTSQNGVSNNVSGDNVSLKNVLLIVLLAILLMMCCCCIVVYTCFRSALQSCCPLFNSTDNSVPYNYDDKYPEAQQQQGYPAYQVNSGQPSNTVLMQTYPNPPVMQQQQAAQNGYPSAPGYAYPSQPYNY